MPRFVMTICLVVPVSLAAATAFAQHYPHKPVRIVTTITGGSLDLTARFIAPGLAESLGQPVIVDNRGGLMSMEIVAKASPDGYTLLLASGSLWLLQFLRSSVPWDPLRDFAPITLAVTLPNIIAVHPSLPAKSVRELIAWAKVRPGELNYSSGQSGSSSHLAGEMFKSMTGVNILHIAYKGGGPAMLALISGETQVSFPNAGSASAHSQSGKIRPLAVASSRPSALFPGLPSAADAGLPGYETGAILALYAPARTPEAIIKRLNQEIVRILNRANVKQRLLDSGAEVVAGSPAELAALMKSDAAVTGKLIRDAGIRVE